MRRQLNVSACAAAVIGVVIADAMHARFAGQLVVSFSTAAILATVVLRRETATTTDFWVVRILLAVNLTLYAVLAVGQVGVLAVPVIVLGLVLAAAAYCGFRAHR